MPDIQLSIVHRLPHCYRWSAGCAGSKVEPILQNTPGSDNALVGLKLLSPGDDMAWPVMNNLRMALSEVAVECAVLECDGELCLFVNSQDEPTATCCLKNVGVAIAETFSGDRPF